jgi:hypothetical protein
MNPDFIKELLLELDSMTYPPERFLQRMFKDIEEFNFPEKFYFEIVDDINWDFITYYPKKFGLSNNLELIKKLYHKNYKILDQTTEQVRSNKSFMIQLATINITALSYIGDDLKKDTDFFYECISLKIRCLSYIPRTHKDYINLAMASILLDPKEIDKLSSDLKNSKEFILQILEKKPGNWPFFYSYLNSEFSKYQDNVFGIHKMMSKPENYFDEKVMNFISSSTNENTELLPIITSCSFGNNLRPGPRFILTNYKKTLLIKIQNKIFDLKIKREKSILKKNEEIKLLVLDINHDYNMFFKNHFEHINHILLKFFLIALIRSLNLSD